MKTTIEHTKHPVYPERPYGSNLWAIKRELGLSNLKLQRLSGLNYGTIARLERGDSKMTEYYKKKLEKATGYRIEIYE